MFTGLEAMALIPRKTSLLLILRGNTAMCPVDEIITANNYFATPTVNKSSDPPDPTWCPAQVRTHTHIHFRVNDVYEAP